MMMMMKNILKSRFHFKYKRLNTHTHIEHTHLVRLFGLVNFHSVCHIKSVCYTVKNGNRKTFMSHFQHIRSHLMSTYTHICWCVCECVNEKVWDFLYLLQSNDALGLSLRRKEKTKQNLFQVCLGLEISLVQACKNTFYDSHKFKQRKNILSFVINVYMIVSCCRSADVRHRINVHWLTIHKQTDHHHHHLIDKHLLIRSIVPFVSSDSK